MNLQQAEWLLLVRDRMLAIAADSMKAVKCQVPWDGIQKVGFDLGVWIHTDEDYIKLDDEGQLLPVPEDFCGSSACVLGHAALMPELNRHGLHIVMQEYDPLIPDGIGFGGHEDFYAGKEFFGLTDFEAHALFLTPFNSSYEHRQHRVVSSPTYRARIIVSLVREHYPRLVENLPAVGDRYLKAVVNRFRHEFNDASTPEQFLLADWPG